MRKKIIIAVIIVIILASQVFFISMLYGQGDKKSNALKRGVLAEFYKCTPSITDMSVYKIDTKTGYTLLENIDISSKDMLAYLEKYNDSKEGAVIRYTGIIKPEKTDDYTFFIVGDDGFRFWINDELVIDFWEVQRDKPQASQQIRLEAGEKYSFKIEHLQFMGSAYLKFEWAGSDKIRQSVPANVFFLPEPDDQDKTVLMEQLSAKIQEAEALLNLTETGNGEKQAPEKAKSNFSKAILKAKRASDSNASGENLLKAISALEHAKIIFMKNITSKQPSKLTSFNNPLYQGQDPFVTYKDGYYYFVSSSNLDSNNRIYVSKSKSLVDQGEKVEVFYSGGSQTRIFAPELFFIDGKWYIYYCADYQEHGWRHYAGVLESVTDDPQGKYIDKGPLFTGENGVNQQANDFTVFEHNGELYGIWGTFLEDPVAPFAPAIVKMDSPTKITQNRSFLPERGGEGPRVLTDGENIWTTVSMGGFAQKNYHLGAYIYKGTGDLLDPKSWTFKDNIFNGTNDVYGAGRASFVKSADGTEDFIMYHSKVYFAENNGWREVHIQRFSWENGVPVLGKPVSPFEFQPLPSGDPGIGYVYQAEDAILNGNTVKGSDLRGYQGDGYVNIGSEIGSEINFIVDVDKTGDYYLRMRYAYGVKVEGEYGVNPVTQLPERGRLSVYVNGTYATTIVTDKTDITWEKLFFAGERISLPKGKNIITLCVDAGDSGNINVDYIAIDEANPLTSEKTSTPVFDLKTIYIIVTIVELIATALLIIFLR